MTDTMARDIEIVKCAVNAYSKCHPFTDADWYDRSKIVYALILYRELVLVDETPSEVPEIITGIIERIRNAPVFKIIHVKSDFDLSKHIKHRFLN